MKIVEVLGGVEADVIKGKGNYGGENSTGSWWG